MPLWSSGKIWDDILRRCFNFNFSTEKKLSPLVWLVYSDIVWEIAYWLLASQISQIPLGQREAMKVHQAQCRFIQHWPDWQTVILLLDKLFSAWTESRHGVLSVLWEWKDRDSNITGPDENFSIKQFSWMLSS